MPRQGPWARCPGTAYAPPKPEHTLRSELQQRTAALRPLHALDTGGRVGLRDEVVPGGTSSAMPVTGRVPGAERRMHAAGAAGWLSQTSATDAATPVQLPGTNSISDGQWAAVRGPGVSGQGTAPAGSEGMARPDGGDASLADRSNEGLSSVMADAMSHMLPRPETRSGAPPLVPRILPYAVGQPLQQPQQPQRQQPQLPSPSQQLH